MVKGISDFGISKYQHSDGLARDGRGMVKRWSKRYQMPQGIFYPIASYAFIMHPAYALEEKVTTIRIGYQAQGVVSWTGCG